MLNDLSGRRIEAGTVLAFILGLVLVVISVTSVSLLLFSIFHDSVKDVKDPGNHEQPVPSVPELFGSEPAKGMFLVAARGLRDPRFQESVIILLSYGREGAMGLVINRRMDILVSEILPELSWLDDRTEQVYYGGPVEGHRIFLLVQARKRPDNSVHVFDDVYVSTSRALFERLVKRPDKNERFRVYAGYAGWAAGQLDAEIRQGDWHITLADAETLFEMDEEKIWPELMRRVTAIQVWYQVGLFPDS